jgi:hypothetical protein
MQDKIMPFKKFMVWENVEEKKVPKNTLACTVLESKLEYIKV